MRRLVRGFKDPITRPRFIVWTGVWIVVLGTVLVGSLIGTSTRWFCNEVCHVVHYDNQKQYWASTHSNVSCIACHIPPELDGVRFAAEKAEKLVDVWETVTGTFHMPLNEDSYIALSMPEYYCTQCHNLSNRTVTPSEGIFIDHEAHSTEGIACAICHNRVAHPEVFELELPGNEKHEDFMVMTACYRCHTLTGESPSDFVASGACGACHPPDFDLVPDTHMAADFFTPYGESAGHARMALAEERATAEARAYWAERGPELAAKRPKPISRLLRIPHGEFVDLPPVAAVNECETCHRTDVFCIGCHGYEMPHPADFAEQHSAAGDADPDGCALCHNKTGDPALNATACDQCHHPAGDPRQTWLAQHAQAARETDILTDCYACHQELFCSGCHVQGEAPTRY